MQPQRFPSSSPMQRYQQPGYMGGPSGARPAYAGQGPLQMGRMASMGGQPMTGQPMSHGGMPSMSQQPSMTHSYPQASKSSKSKHKSEGRDEDLYEQPGMQRSASMQQQLDRKRSMQADPRHQQMQQRVKKKKKMADKILPQRVRELVPESQAYMDLLAFERKLDQTIMRKRLDIQEALKRPMKQKKKLRIFISNTFYPAKHEDQDGDETMASWELRVEGRLLEDSPKGGSTEAASKMKRKFSSFFKSLVIELDKDLYGPDNHLVEWHRTPSTQETDGFQVKRAGDQNVKCTVLLMLDYQPMQFKLDARLARLLGVHTQTRPVIINSLWQYIKSHKLQDCQEREYINNDKYLQQIFECERMKFCEIPTRLHALLQPPDPIVINHVISVDAADSKKTACYDIDVEVDETLKVQMQNFLLSTQSQQEITGLDSKIHETVETINQLKVSRDFFLSFSKEPQEFINNWLISQNRDLKTMTDTVGRPEYERAAEFYTQGWTHEAVNRYFYNKVQQRRVELEQTLGIRNQWDK